MKKRILIFSLTYYPNFIGGAEVAIKEITDRIGDEFEFDLVTLRLSKCVPTFERIGNVNVYRVGWASSKRIDPTHIPFWVNLNKYMMPLTGFFKAVSLSRKHHYSVLWSMMATYNSFAALFVKIIFPQVKFLLTLQEGDPIPYIKKRALPVWPLFKLIFTKADCIQTISKYLADFGRDMGAKGPVFVVPNAVDIKKFTREVSEDELSKAKEKLQKKDGDIVLITTSRLVSKNAVEDVISALKFLPDNMKFVIAGRGYMEESLKMQARVLGVGQRIVWLGHVSHNEMPALFKASDIFIRTPISEGFGNSYVEAMAAGLPCVATEVGGIVDFIKDRETGIFAKVHNPKDIAEKVTILIENKELYSKIKIQAFEMVKEKYDWEIVAKEMKNIFENM